MSLLQPTTNYCKSIHLEAKIAILSTIFISWVRRRQKTIFHVNIKPVLKFHVNAEAIWVADSISKHSLWGKGLNSNMGRSKG